MRVLIADDDEDIWPMLRQIVETEGHEVEFVADGNAAWDRLSTGDPPDVALLDWKMPGADGFELCRRLRDGLRGGYVYTILLTAHGGDANYMAGFEAGADDFLEKPANPMTLRARFKAAARIIGLERALRDRVEQLEESVGRIKHLEGLLPLCMHCRRIRNSEDTWTSLEAYAQERAGAKFTHGLCEECRDEHYPAGSIT